jgi:CheY-like chemotaxis protein
MVRKSFFSIVEISQFCKVTPESVQNWIREGSLKLSITPDESQQVRREDLLEFLTLSHRRTPEALCKPVRRVLMVDDEPEVIELMVAMFDTIDWEIETEGVQNGIEALARIAASKPDLLILDAVIPGMMGIDVCRKLKSEDATRNMKIIAISGDHDEYLKQALLEAGADSFFTKPFDMLRFRNECLKLL